MDYMGIVKRAWGTTWRYKILWLFGLFVGAGGGGGNFNSGGGGGGNSSGLGSSDKFASQMNEYLPLIIAVAVFVVLLSIVFFVLTFAAQGGLIHLVRESEEGRPVRAADGWREGFSRWGRVFLIDFLIGLPMIVVVIVIALVFGASIVGLIAGGAGLSNGTSGAASGAAIGALGAGIGALCLGILLMVVLILAYSIVFGTVGELALRYGVLQDMPAVQALKQGWHDFWGKRGAVLMYLVTWATRIVYGLAVGILVAVLIVPAVLLAIAGVWPAALGLGGLAILLAMVPAAIYGTFLSSAWTIFFRRMTGAEQVAVSPAFVGGYPPVPGSPVAPPADPWSAANQIAYEPAPPEQEG